MSESITEPRPGPLPAERRGGTGYRGQSQPNTPAVNNP
jgi:hypothetical protein